MGGTGRILDTLIFSGGSVMDRSEELIARARRGDAEAFERIFEEHHRFVYRFLYSMVGDAPRAEELTQETFLRAYRGLDGLQGAAKLSTWLCGIARNTALNEIRSRRKERGNVSVDEIAAVAADDRATAPDQHMLSSELGRVIRTALDRLDEDKRAVFTLKVLQQKSYDEIAAITGSSVSKLKTDLHRAKADMRRTLRPYVEASDDV